ncbi:hypothetical protein AHAS_Ahas17G0149800 [Arachis hypogaea]
MYFTDPIRIGETGKERTGVKRTHQPPRSTDTRRQTGEKEATERPRSQKMTSEDEPREGNEGRRRRGLAAGCVASAAGDDEPREGSDTRTTARRRHA